jgi:hypothetical protein
MSQTQTRKHMPEWQRPAYRAAVKAGWTVTRTANGHWKWKPPQGRIVITPGNQSSCCHAKGNDLALLRRAGLPC